MTGKLLEYHLKNPGVPLVVRVPQFENHCFRGIIRSGSAFVFLRCFKLAHICIQVTFNCGDFGWFAYGS